MKKGHHHVARSTNASPNSGKDVVVRRNEWFIISDIRAIEPLVHEVSAFCQAAGIGERACRFKIPVALTEALSNAIIRGNRSIVSKRVRLVLRMTALRVEFEVTDEGSGFDFNAKAATPDDADWLEREDGRGLFLMRSLMDHVEFERDAHRRGQTVRLVLLRT